MSAPSVTPTVTPRRSSTGAPGLRWWCEIALAVSVRPWLWPTAVVQVLVLAPSGWWRRWPHLPMPADAYLRFRSVTAYGDASRQPAPDDVVTYLHWCRAWPRVTR